MTSRLLTLCILLLFPVASLAQGVVFPMTIWGSLHLEQDPVQAGATVQFIGEDGTVLGELVTEKIGSYGGNSVYDANVALSAFNGVLQITVLIDGESYTVIPEQMDDSEKGDGCPNKDSLTFVSQSCRYDITIFIPVCAADDWEYGAWSSCDGGTQTRTANTTRTCTGSPAETISRTCTVPKEETNLGGGNGGNDVESEKPPETRPKKEPPPRFLEAEQEADLPPALVVTGDLDGEEEEKLKVKQVEEIPDSALVFRDISGHWSEGYIRSLARKEILENQKLFRPDVKVNRAEFLKVVLETLHIPLQEGEVQFSDVPENAWYAPYVKTAFTEGIVQGYPDGSFQAGKSINRAEGLKILLVAAGIENPNGLVPFHDVSKRAWFAGHIGYAYEHGLVQGVSATHFAPEENLTRAQMAKIIHLFLLLSPSAS